MERNNNVNANLLCFWAIKAIKFFFGNVSKREGVFRAQNIKMGTVEVVFFHGWLVYVYSLLKVLSDPQTN
jgi:hypothetical protein